MPSSASADAVVYTLSLHDALPIYRCPRCGVGVLLWGRNRPRPHRVYDIYTCGTYYDTKGQVVTHEGEHCTPVRRGEDMKVEVDIQRSEEHTSELQSRGHLVCRLLLLPTPWSTLFPYTTLFRSTVALVVG